MIRLLIADDHMVVREGLKRLLTDSDEFTITAEAATVAEALARLHDHDLDVMLLDISMPDMDGLKALGLIRRQKPDLPVLLFSAAPEEEFALAALKEGAAGFVSKDSPPEQLREAIRRAFAGGKYIGPELAAQLLSGTGAVGQKPHERLSKRELDILLRITRGESLTEIGEALNVSVKTVSSHRSHILEKMQLQSNADLVRYVVKHRLE
jgi:two-component system, NarL family, invasion response regulator UvrY